MLKKQELFWLSFRGVSHLLLLALVAGPAWPYEFIAECEAETEDRKKQEPAEVGFKAVLKGRLWRQTLPVDRGINNGSVGRI